MNIQKRLVALFLLAVLIIGVISSLPKIIRTRQIHKIEKTILRILTKNSNNEVESVESGFLIPGQGGLILNTQVLLKSSKINIHNPHNDAYSLKKIIAENNKYGIVAASLEISTPNSLHTELTELIAAGAGKNETIWAVGYRHIWSNPRDDFIFLDKYWRIGKFVFGIKKKSILKTKPLAVKRTITEVAHNSSGAKIYKIKGYFPYGMQGCPVINKWGHIIGIVGYDKFPCHIIPIDALRETEPVDMSLSKFVEIIKKSPEYFYEEGMRFFSSCYYNDALACFKKTIILNRDFADGYFQMARCYEKMIPQNRTENIENAIRTYKKAIELYPDNAEAYYRLGKILLWDSDEKQSSIKHFQKCIDLKDDFVDAYLSLASAYSLTGNRDMSLKTLEKASHKFDDNIKILTNLGMTYTWCGKREAAITTLKKVIELKPDDTMAYSQLAVALSNNTTAEIKIYKKILEMDPGNKIAISNLAECYNRLDSKKGQNKSYAQKAKKYYKKALDTDSPSILTLCQTADYHSRQKDRKNAMAAINEALRQKPDSSLPYFYLGLIYSNFGEYEKAVRAYRNSLRLKPEYIHKHARFNLVGNYLRTNNKAAAKKEYEILKKEDKKFSALLDTKFK